MVRNDIACKNYSFNIYRKKERFFKSISIIVFHHKKILHKYLKFEANEMNDHNYF